MLSRATHFQVGERLYPLTTYAAAVGMFNAALGACFMSGRTVKTPTALDVLNDHGEVVGKVWHDRVTIGLQTVYIGPGSV